MFGGLALVSVKIKFFGWTASATAPEALPFVVVGGGTFEVQPASIAITKIRFIPHPARRS